LEGSGKSQPTREAYPIRPRRANETLSRGDRVLAGTGPADVHNRDPRELPPGSGGASVIGNGILAKADNADVVFC